MRKDRSRQAAKDVLDVQPRHSLGEVRANSHRTQQISPRVPMGTHAHPPLAAALVGALLAGTVTSAHPA